MLDREAVEKLLAELRREEEEAEAQAEHAREMLAQTSIKELKDVDAELVERAADDLAAAVRQVKLISRLRSRLRGLIS